MPITFEKPTGKLRWLVERITAKGRQPGEVIHEDMPPKLQQQVRDADTGRLDWCDVETVVEVITKL